jgi:hypothetical protein
MISRTFHESVIPGVALAPVAVGTAGALGLAIVNPWREGRLLNIFLMAGVLHASDVFTVTVQARRIGTSTWDPVKINGGVGNLTFTVAETSKGGDVEGGVLLGTINLARLKSGAAGNLPPVSSVQYEYDALRLAFANSNNTSPGVIGACYIISDLFSVPSETTDDLFFKQLPYTAS